MFKVIFMQILISSVPRIKEIDWRLDYILSSNFLEKANICNVQLFMKTNGTLTENGILDTTQTLHHYELTSEKCRVLLNGKNKKF
jgi:hypothetical protein